MIDTRLLNESFFLGKLSLCHALFRDDSRFPWIILVPDLPHVTDFDDLPETARHNVSNDIALAGRALKHVWPVEKINMASIGNKVPQCHIHVVGRTKSDSLWPEPVWGIGERVPYGPDYAQERTHELCRALGLNPQGKL